MCGVNNFSLVIYNIAKIDLLAKNIMEKEEVDASLIFKQPASNLRKVKNLEDTLKSFGYSVDDRIEHRELVLIYRNVEKELESMISECAQSGRYNEAKDTRARLTHIRSEFDSLQSNAVKKVKEDQKSLFSKASSSFLNSMSKKCEEESETVKEICERLQGDLFLTQSIQTENLEHELSLIPKPRMKYSKLANEWMVAEKELIRLCQYDDARKVRKKLDLLIPKEKEKFYEEFEAKKELRRLNLKKKQEMDRTRLDEKLKGVKWNEVRKIEKSLKM